MEGGEGMEGGRRNGEWRKEKGKKRGESWIKGGELDKGSRNQTLEKPKGGSGKLTGVEVYTVPGMQAHFRLIFD